MSKVNKLISSYSKYIAIPWRSDAAAPQRVICCVYSPNEELRLRAKIDEFELATREAGHGWSVFDLTNTFGEWLAGQRYAEKYYVQPSLLSTLMQKYLSHIEENFTKFIIANGANENSVVALQGVGSLFGLLKVKDVMEKLAPLIHGRLVVLFPGSYEDNNYQLLDGYDGWNYLAIPITANKEF